MIIALKKEKYYYPTTQIYYPALQLQRGLLPALLLLPLLLLLLLSMDF